MDQFTARKYVIMFLVLTLSLLFVLRLFYLQAIDKDFKQFAEENILQKRYIYPPRGVIYDRHGNVLVSNETVYDLMVVPNKVNPFDTASFCEIINISREAVRKQLRSARAYSPFKASVFVKNLSVQTYGVLQERLYEFRGFYSRSRTNRKYPNRVAPHVLGYLGEVEHKDINKAEGYYHLGDLKGKSGLEKYYEKELRGKKGVRNILVDALNREQGTYLDGELDIPSEPGQDLKTTLDYSLQAYGEKLMEHKLGAIVAIVPQSGEVLSMVSSPEYDPGLLAGRSRSNNFKKLLNNKYKPLLNRAIAGLYSPGSTFKLIMGVLGLDEGVISKSTQFNCNNGYYIPGLHIGCHEHRSPVAFNYSIITSCNAYYCNVFRHLIDQDKFSSVASGYQHWRKRVKNFGFGNKLGIDLPGEKQGILYSARYYDKLYGKGRWKSPTILSLAIGQSEISITPLQLANLSCIIANRGYYVEPHFVKDIQGKVSEKASFEKHFVKVDTQKFELLGDAMYDVVEKGTGRWYAKVPGIEICGKTGTVENPHGEDHSVFIAFAPKDNPKIAVAAIIERAGFGSMWAAPVASLMIEKYLNKKIVRKRVEKRILEKNFIRDYEKQAKEKKEKLQLNSREGEN